MGDQGVVFLTLASWLSYGVRAFPVPRSEGLAPLLFISVDVQRFPGWLM